MLQQFVTFEEWRNRVRPLLSAGVEPRHAGDVLAGIREAPISTGQPMRLLTLPSRLMRLLESVSCFRADGRYDLMYRLAWRVLFENPRLLEDAADGDVRHATKMDAAVRRDIHKMHAFVRFREVENEQKQPAYFAWFEPTHEILRRGSLFFKERFPNMRWTIATPDGTAIWDLATLHFVATLAENDRPASDDYESLWRTYYRNICNVARINPSVMRREMPRKYWKNLPEAEEIGGLIGDRLVNLDSKAEAAEEGIRMTRAVEQALAAIPSSDQGPSGCRRCDLWRHATQAVPGAGPSDASIVLVGEQPGDEEDLRGQPFVGPAGRLLDQAITAAGLVREDLYVTNAVKHFKWEPRGKRRLHKKPESREVSACSVWLDKEVSDIRPAVIVALGTTAVRALLGSALSIESARQRELADNRGRTLIATYHPAAILRAEGDRAHTLRTALIGDLRRAREVAAAAAPRAVR